MRFVSIAEVVEIHRRVIEQSGGARGIRDQGALESSVVQPLQVFADQELYPSLAEKAAALGFFLIQTTRLWTATNARDMRHWKSFLSSTAMN